MTVNWALRKIRHTARRLKPSPRRRSFAAWRRNGCIIPPDLSLRCNDDQLGFIEMGRDVAVERNVTFWLAGEPEADPRLVIGARAYIGTGSYIGAYQPVHIGGEVLIGAYTYIISGNHKFRSRTVPIQDQGYEGGPITISDGVWIGTHCVVLPSVRVGQGAIVGAGSVVTKDVPDWAIVAGVPARLIRFREGGPENVDGRPVAATQVRKGND